MLLILSLLPIGFALIPLIKNSRSTVNRSLFLFVLFASLWVATLNLQGMFEGMNLLFVRSGFFFAVVMAFTIFYFSNALANSSKNHNRLLLPAFIFSLLLAGLSLTPYVVSSAEPYLVNGQRVASIVNRGNLYVPVVLWILALVVYSVFIILKKSNESTGSTKLQLNLVAFGLISGIAIGSITNVILPNVQGNTYYGKFGFIAILIWAIFIGYAIVKHRFLDIRLVIARSIGYLLSVLSLASIYMLVVFLGVNRFVIRDLPVSFEQQAIYAAIAVALAFSFQPLKKLFDKVTNSIFYRDAYDAQSFLDELNRLLVSTVDIEHLLKGGSEIIERNLKSSYCSFVIRETSYFEQRVIGGKSGSFSDIEMKVLKSTTPHLHSKVIAEDEMKNEHPDLAEVLRAHDVAVLVRLVSTLDYNVEGIGYIILGEKKSGNPYTSQDLQILEIIANELVIAVQNALRFEEIEEFNVTLQEKVDDATKKLRQTNEKLKQMDETKDEFISMASHQLRTPLTSVKGYLSMVLEGDAGEIKPMQEKLLSQAFTSSQRMVYLIADLLNVSRLRTGKFVIEPIKANLAEIIEGEVQQLKETASSRKLELVYDKPKDFPLLMLDETKVRQVVMNFIDNAIYYTPGGGTITIKLEDKKDSIEYTVTDTGMGVPKADQQHLFSKFYRASNARKARPDGTGLGLFMSKKVVIAQGGAIIFKSKEGEGSTFGFTLPKEKLIPQDNDEDTDLANSKQ